MKATRKDNKDAKLSPNKPKTAEEQKLFDECKEAGVCYHFKATGQCSFGDKCRFTHEHASKRQQSSTKECRLCGSGAHTAATCPAKAGKPKSIKVTAKRERRGSQSESSAEEGEDDSDDRPLKRRRE